MLIKPHQSTPSSIRTPGDPYAGIRFATRTITTPSSGEQFEAVFPDTWSEGSAQIFATHYFRRAGVPSATEMIDEEPEPGERAIPDWLRRSVPTANATFGPERDVREVFHRLAGAWSYWGWRGGYFADETKLVRFFTAVRTMLARQIAFPNSPQFFSTGLHWAYGLTGTSAGHVYVDCTGSIATSTDRYSRLSPFACYLIGTEDSLVGPDSIFDWITTEARIFQAGAGAGTNASHLRAKGEPLSNGGTSSGVMSFLHVSDTAAGAIKSGGTTRRAAKMLLLDDDHPDIEAFIDLKAHEDRKIAALAAGSRLLERHLNVIIAAAAAGTDPATNTALADAVRAADEAGIPGSAIAQAMRPENAGAPIEMTTKDTDYRSETVATMTGQNANFSVRLTDAFMAAVVEGRDWNLIRRTDGGIAKTVRARDIWDQLAQAAWRTGDPGVQYHDTINRWHTHPANGPIRASNPCAEFTAVDNSACNLASLRLTAFLNDDGTFAIAEFRGAVRTWTQVLDISIFGGQLPTEKIARNTYALRHLGLGYTDLGGLFLRLGLPYDSDAARCWAAAITSLMTATAYEASASMAQLVGPFADFEKNRRALLAVLDAHALHAMKIADGKSNVANVRVSAPDIETLIRAAHEAWKWTVVLAQEHGLRNCQVTLIAPAGTIGLALGCDTTGAEPLFSGASYKKLAGGGAMTIASMAFQKALTALGYDLEARTAILDHIATHNTAENAPGLDSEDLAVFDCASPAGGRATSRQWGMSICSRRSNRISRPRFRRP